MHGRDQDPPETEPPAEAATPTAQEPIAASEILQGASVLHIEHNGEIYTLRVTRNNRLILTK